MENKLHNYTQSLINLGDTITSLEACTQLQDDIVAAISRGYFRPKEEQRLLDWFMHFLTIRESLWEIIDEASNILEQDINLVNTLQDWRYLITGYVAASLVIRMDHFLVDELAAHKLTQRKLNEPYLSHRIQRKQYTRIFKALTSPANVLLLLQVMTFIGDNKLKIKELAEDDVIGDLAKDLSRYTSYIDPGKRRYLKRRLRFRWHSFRRRFAVAKQNVSFVFLEQSGRVIADIGARHRDKRVTHLVHSELEALLKPGDVIVTRHDWVASNLFLPGFWPHCALYIGTEQQRLEMGIVIDEPRQQRWSGDKCVLEAQKDGVLFRPLSETFDVDAVAILRPVLATKIIAERIAVVCEHEGKGYNFDFDFFSSDKLVCTEVVYRAYDGIEPIHFTLQERAGRPTLSAEDILDLALETEMFAVVAVFGTPANLEIIVQGEQAHECLKVSYK